MARTLNESPLTTRNARASLPLGLHWRGLDREVHLGYRKGKRGGVWLVRWRCGPGYRQAPLGTADDALKAGTLDFTAACKAARAHVEKARLEAVAEALGPPLTVRAAVEAYVSERDARASRRAGRALRSDAGQRLGRYVLGRQAHGKHPELPGAALTEVRLATLKEADLASWMVGLPETLKATTRQRLINDLKAALNAAYVANREQLDPTLPATIKHGLRPPVLADEADPVARDSQILTDAEVAEVIRAARDVDIAGEWEGDLFRLVVVLAATGCRFSQARRLRVGDCQISAGRLLVPVSRKGKGSRSGIIQVPVGPDVLDALQPIVIGRGVDEPLLERWRHKQVKGAMRWERAERRAWQSASELVRPWRAIRARTEMPEVIPYSLRHSSIVRGIRANLPIRLVAAAHDTSVAMIERHYAKWITSGLEEMTRQAIVPLVPASPKISFPQAN